MRVERHRRTSELPQYQFPTDCPDCGTQLIKDEGGVYIRCPNLRCPAQVKERIRYFASRNAMDIEGLGDKLVEQLVRSKQVVDYADLFDLTVEDLCRLDRMGEKSSENLVDSIARSKDRGLARVLNALSIRHVGTRVAAVLASHFKSIEQLQEASPEDISAVHEVGDVIAASVVDFLHNEFGERSIEGLKRAGVGMVTDDTPIRGRVWEGKTLVVTGKLVKYTRDEINRLIQAHGGHPASSVSRKTDYLVAGEKAGSKLEKARKLGVTVMSEDEFERQISDTD